MTSISPAMRSSCKTLRTGVRETPNCSHNAFSRRVEPGFNSSNMICWYSVWKMSWLENACMSGDLLLFSILKNIAPLPPSVNDTPQHLDDCLIRVYDFATHSGTLRATIMLTNHKVYLKSRKFSLFLQPQLDFALKTLESIKDSCGFCHEAIRNNSRPTGLSTAPAATVCHLRCKNAR